MSHSYTLLRPAGGLSKSRISVLAVVAIFTVLAGVTFVLPGENILANKLNLQNYVGGKKPTWVPHKEPLPGVCTAEELAALDWIEADTPITSIPQILELNRYHPESKTFCAALTPRPAQTDPNFLAWENERTVEVGKYVRETPNCRVYEPLEKAMIKRLLRSKAGLTLVGDSLTRYQFDMLSTYLAYPGSPIVRRNYNVGMAGLNLDPNHPDTKALLEDAGVPEVRLQTPLITLISHWYIVERAEMEQIFGVKYNYRPTGLLLLWYDNFLELVGLADMINPKDGPWEQNILQVNVGAHWGSENGNNLSDEEMYASFKEMTDIAANKLRSMDTATPVQIIWRAISPGHVDCETHARPNNSMTTGQHPERPTKNRYQWQMFPDFNRYTQEAIAKSTKSRKAYPQAPIQYADIWQMSVKRPDAHSMPPADCLHWCNYNIMAEWKRLIWHMIMVDSKYDDYY